jgi:hypothetical protein
VECGGFSYLPVSRATGERFAFMAPVGQNSWQQKQRMHLRRLILALPF